MPFYTAWNLARKQSGGKENLRAQLEASLNDHPNIRVGEVLLNNREDSPTVEIILYSPSALQTM